MIVSSHERYVGEVSGLSFKAQGVPQSMEFYCWGLLLHLISPRSGSKEQEKQYAPVILRRINVVRAQIVEVISRSDYYIE